MPDDKFLKDLGRRTPGEELWLARKAAGLTAYQAARRAGVGRGRYRDAERDRKPGVAPAQAGLKAVPRPDLAALLALARRRSGLGLAGVAARVKATRPTVHAWERAGEPFLKLFWELRGFRFPVSLH